ncbi:hypothetical protein ACJIZ3_020749 [Penstemon smallii]|uniref:Uncharacterized protein n=1 Tax=Penstemon smallii TaxID=265156 RepID=A0ABD3SJG6_9LAMI
MQLRLNGIPVESATNGFFCWKASTPAPATPSSMLAVTPLNRAAEPSVRTISRNA